MLLRFILEAFICVYSIYFWYDIINEYKYLREKREIIIEIMFEGLKFLFHLIVLSLSLYVSLTEMYGDPDESFVYLQLLCFLGIIDYLTK